VVRPPVFCCGHVRALVFEFGDLPVLHGFFLVLLDVSGLGFLLAPPSSPLVVRRVS